MQDETTTVLLLEAAPIEAAVLRLKSPVVLFPVELPHWH